MNHTHTEHVHPIVDGIFEIETYYLGLEKYAACYLVVARDEVAIIETNTNYAVPRILAALVQLGLKKEQVKYIILTHIHLDHAGGAGLLMQELPHAELVVHPRGRKHMITPEKLIESVKEVYGKEKYVELYGEILPIPAQRVVTGDDGLCLHVGDRDLVLLHMDGHAKHHLIVHDASSQSVFSGDNFGIGYPAFTFGTSRLLFPSTSPIQFEPEQALKTYQRIVDLHPARILLTHYGVFEDIPNGHQQLVRWIEFSTLRASFHYAAGQREHSLLELLRHDLWEQFAKEVFALRGSGLTQVEKKMLEVDVDLNAQGIAHYISKKDE